MKTLALAIALSIASISYSQECTPESCPAPMRDIVTAPVRAAVAVPVAVIQSMPEAPVRFVACKTKVVIQKRPRIVKRVLSKSRIAVRFILCR